VTWWHLEALAARLSELLPQQSHLWGTESTVEWPQTSTGRPGDPDACSRPTDSLGAAPGAREPVQHDQGAESGHGGQRQAPREGDCEALQDYRTEMDIALYPILWGPAGVLRARRRDGGF
jgi:hypothetical protein